MTIDLHHLLGPSGVRAAAELTGLVDAGSVGRWVRQGRLLRPAPGVLALPDAVQSWPGRADVATHWAHRDGGRGWLTGAGALALWDVLPDPGPVVDLAVDHARRAPTGAPPWLRVHRAPVPEYGVRADRPVTMPPRALVDAWGWAHATTGSPSAVEVARAAVIGAVRRRVCRVREIRRELRRHPNLPGRAALVELLDLVEGGCQSEFEIWGLAHLLDVPGLPPVQQQLALDTAVGTVHFDGGWEAARLGVELDGARYHRQPEQHEWDVRRDAAVVARGWVTLRISHRRGHDDPEACQRDIAAAFFARCA